MDVLVPLNAAAGSAALLIAVSIALMVKSATLLERTADTLRDLSDAIRDLRIATLGMRQEFTDGIRDPATGSPASGRGTQPAGPWPWAASPDG